MDKLTSGIIAILIVSILLNVVLMVSPNQSQQNDITFLKSVIKISVDDKNIEDKATLAEEYYSMAIVSYDLEDYDSMITNCEASRRNSADYVSDVRDIKSRIKNRQETLFVIYSKIYDETIDIYNNLYESCEYLESAARSYKLDNYEMGSVNIDGSNEKIDAHDVAVNRYNELLSDYFLELENLSK